MYYVCLCMYITTTTFVNELQHFFEWEEEAIRD